MPTGCPSRHVYVLTPRAHDLGKMTLAGVTKLRMMS